jgi:N-methylhydantoinase B
MSNDPVVVEVIANRLDEIQRIMKHRLFHTGYSTILRESFDGSAGLTDGNGRVIVPGMTMHAASYSKMVSAILTKYAAQIEDGDVFITNDPYRGGTSHTPDVGVATPVFISGRLVAFCTSIGHKSDIGGLAPGSVSALSRSVFHEGILVPPIKLVRRGEEEEGVFALLANNSRAPDLLLGDVRGQVGCTKIGADLLQALAREFDLDTILAVMDELVTTSEQMLRRSIAGLPDGEQEAENFLDGDNVSDEPVRIHVKVVKEGERLRLDFSGCSAQTVGPANSVPTPVMSAAVAALVSFLDHRIPVNQGVLDAIEFIIPEGSCVNPRSPAPVNSYFPTAHLVFNGVLEALGKMLPERAVSQSGLGLGAVSFGFGGGSVLYELGQTGLGGTADRDGASIVHPVGTFETITPIEILETEYPLRVREFGVRIDSAGAGKHRGGLGYVREYEVLRDCHIVTRLSARKTNARGIGGGLPPRPPRTVINRGRPDERMLKGLDVVDLVAGDTFRLEQSGGAGWGDPRERDRALIEADIADGFVSDAEAARLYGYGPQG